MLTTLCKNLTICVCPTLSNLRLDHIGPVGPNSSAKDTDRKKTYIGGQKPVHGRPTHIPAVNNDGVTRECL